MKRYVQSTLVLAVAALLAACGGGRETTTLVQPSAAAPGVKALALAQSSVNGAGASALDTRLRGAHGKVEVWVSLSEDSLARRRAQLVSSGGQPSVRALAASSGEGGRAQPAAIRTEMLAQRARVQAQQADVGGRLRGLGAKVQAQVTMAHNAIAVSVDASQLQAISQLPGVAKVRPVLHYQLDLAETVPYVGGSSLQNSGFDGSGVRVAVLDSGIDYTHRNLGGSGALADYATATANPAAIPVGLFPSAKVVGGYDFVGSAWPSNERTEDVNPIDDGPAGGHGSHVADIIAGRSLDGLHKGMAPGAQLYAVKVCSSVSSSCNGIALLKGMDFALDPNGDGDPADAVDVINMSLGSPYGQIEDDLTLASSNAVALGTVVVVSAGNSADRPYIVGSPSIAPGAISVAQTQVPSASSVPLVIGAPASIAGTYLNTATLAWAPVLGTTSGEVVDVGRACAADPLSANPAGKIALVIRGACNISDKVDKAVNAGAVGVLVMLSAPGDAQTFSQGAGGNFRPSLVIQNSLGLAIRARLTAGEVVSVTLAAGNSFSIAGSVVGSSSRGPSMSTQGIKPEIGAPGASVSANFGSGSGQSAFGGTSGAAPMVAGAAAQLIQAHPARSALQIKAMLMNSAETQIYTSQAVYPGQLAPISRIGSGELRVNRAAALSGAAWDVSAMSAALSFGAVEAYQQITVKRTLTVENYSNSAKQYSVTPSFRYADDQASGAVRLIVPATVTVAANSSASLSVSLLINPAKLAAWSMNGGPQGGNGQGLNGPEYDGYLTLVAGGEKLSVPWHVLPRKAASASAAYSASRGAIVTLVNSGAEVADYGVFALVGSSAKLPAAALPQPGDNFAAVDLKSVGVRYLSDCGVTGGCLQWAISTHGRRAHPLYPGGFDVEVDVSGDGQPDFAVFQTELSGFGVTGQSGVAIRPINSGTGTIYFYNNADLNSGVVQYTVPLSAFGAGVSAATTFRFSVSAWDNYFSGIESDAITDMVFTPASPRYALSGGALPFGTVNKATSARLGFVSNAATVPASLSSESGFLVVFARNAGNETQEIKPQLPAP